MCSPCDHARLSYLAQTIKDLEVARSQVQHDLEVETEDEEQRPNSDFNRLPRRRPHTRANNEVHRIPDKDNKTRAGYFEAERRVGYYVLRDWVAELLTKAIPRLKASEMEMKVRAFSQACDQSRNIAHQRFADFRLPGMSWPEAQERYIAAVSQEEYEQHMKEVKDELRIVIEK